ncbi:MAG: ABC transporter ATP-binding protein [Clostridiales bacterium]|nr:ABC transporter ATP-binding protein [Clostridiales bacterium]
MEIVKDSWVRTFSGSLKSFLASYQDGQRNNERRMRDFERTTQKHNRLTARGKSPTWKVIPAALVDMELVQENIANLMSNLKAHYEALNAGIGQADERQRAVQLLEYLKENAAGIVNRVTKYSAKAKALRLMEEVGIPEPRLRYRQYPFEFSGGMRQRIVIAIALAANPDILICDEPTTALDVTIQSQILELINKLKQERDLSIIFITPDLGVVANMADRIAVMYAGKIVEYGTAEEVFYSPKHPYTWALLSSMPDLETKEKLEAIPGTPPNMIYPPKGDAFAERSRYAMEIDFEEEPPFFRLSDTHWAATWLLHPDAPRVEPPRLVSERVAKVNARLEGNADV